MPDNNRIEQAAQFLIEEHRTCKTFGPIPSAFAPRSVEEAYAMQEMFRNLMAVKLGPIAGYKIALTTPVMQQMVGFNEPIFGGIMAKTIHQSSCTVHYGDFGHLGIECELAARLEADLPAGRGLYSRDQVAEAIGALMVAFELIDDRNADYKQLALQILSGIADNVWNAGIVLGPPVTDWRSVDLAAAHGTMVIDGTPVGEGYGKDVMGHPLDAVMWLANTLTQRGKYLSRGMVVMTGSIVATKFVQPPNAVRFRVEGLGEVCLSIA